MLGISETQKKYEMQKRCIRSDDMHKKYNILNEASLTKYLYIRSARTGLSRKLKLLRL